MSQIILGDSTFCSREEKREEGEKEEGSSRVMSGGVVMCYGLTPLCTFPPRRCECTTVPGQGRLVYCVGRPLLPSANSAKGANPMCEERKVRPHDLQFPNFYISSSSISETNSLDSHLQVRIYFPLLCISEWARIDHTLPIRTC